MVYNEDEEFLAILKIVINDIRDSRYLFHTIVQRGI